MDSKYVSISQVAGVKADTSRAPIPIPGVFLYVTIWL